MIKFKRDIVIASAVCICIGFLSCSVLVMAYTKINSAQTDNINNLTQLLQSADDKNKELMDEIELKNQMVSDYEEAVSKDDAALKLMKEELEETRKASGETEMKGKGVVVTVNDSKADSTGAASASFVIHDEDLLLFVNELNSAGAEAVSINGQRITSRSSIKCAGSIINVNGVRVSAPFVIKAIGDPEVLESALRFKGGVIDSLIPWGFSIDVSQEDEIVIEPYAQGFTYQFASETQTENQEETQSE